MKGWVSVHRQLKDNWLWKDKPFSKGQAWIDILLRVNHKPNKVPIGNKIIDVYEGQTLWSVKAMADEWGWSRKKVDNFLNTLQTESQITKKSTSKYTLISVVNWELYQTEEHQKNINGTSNEHQRNTNNNDNNENNTFSEESDEYKLSNYLYNHILKNNPNHKKPNLQSWSKHIDYMIRLDNRNVEDIKRVIKWCQNDEFWKPNILSTKKLREKYDALYMKMGNVKGQVEEDIYSGMKVYR